MSNVPSEIQSKFDEKYACLKKVYDVGAANERGIYQNADGSWQCHYAPWVQISILPDGRCFETHGAICERWYKENGWIGLPISDEEEDGPDGRISHFEHGDIRWSRTTNTCEVRKREVPLDIQKQVEPIEVQKPEESAEVLAHLEAYVPEDI